MDSKIVSINILTYNGQKFIEACLNSVLKQTYPNIEVLVVDNNSTDNTIEKVKEILREFKGNQRVILNKRNLGFAGGHNIGIRESRGKYIVCLNQDVVLDKDFVKYGVEATEEDKRIGSVQAKVLQLNNGIRTNIIDTVGFTVFKSGKILDTGQGEKDKGQYDSLIEIFGVNGVAPFYRREALNDVKLGKEYFDEDFFCYAEDFDLAFRFRWNGWKCIYSPKAILWHDRTSSKSAGGGWKEFRMIRKSQLLWMRKISWRNLWLAFIKNLPLSSFFKLPFLKRQIKFFFYLFFFEPKVLFSIFEIIKLMPRMLSKRKIIMKNKNVRFNPTT
ncbi:MAG: glycosyltransferase family 2 protein [Patescibacteria group bacterium]